MGFGPVWVRFGYNFGRLEHRFWTEVQPNSPGGVASTVAGSWIASKIRVYHDDRKSHHQELKDRILRPLRDLLAEQQALFSHRVPVLTEKRGYSEIVHARPDQDAVRSDLVLHCHNPWDGVLLELDRALFEDANRIHYKKLLAEILAVATSWDLHIERCRMWVAEIGNEILDSSLTNESVCAALFSALRESSASGAMDI